METVFVAYSFRDPDHDLLVSVQRLIESHDLRMVTGRNLAGGEVSKEVERLIQRSGAVVALAMPDAQTVSGRYNTYPWVTSEYVIGHKLEKPVIALVHREVDLAGAYAEHEKISYDPDRPTPAIVHLSEVLGQWRRRDGRQVKVLIGQEKLAERVARQAARAQCRWRCYDGHGQPSEWRDAILVPEQGGPVIYLEHVPEGALVEVSIKLRGKRWVSSAVSSALMVVRLEQEEEET